MNNIKIKKGDTFSCINEKWHNNTHILSKTVKYRIDNIVDGYTDALVIELNGVWYSFKKYETEEENGYPNFFNFFIDVKKLRRAKLKRVLKINEENE